MKYIRTKDDIIEKQDKEQVFEKLHYFYTYDIDKRDYEYREDDIVKQSDTIEELCDQFVFIDDFYLHEHRVCHSFENAIALSKKHNVDIKTFRGAIWTDKGLIYVAKMNDKGELELL